MIHPVAFAAYGRCGDADRLPGNGSADSRPSRTCSRVGVWSSIGLMPVRGMIVVVVGGGGPLRVVDVVVGGAVAPPPCGRVVGFVKLGNALLPVAGTRPS